MAQRGHHHVASSQKALMLELKSFQDEPVEGFKITLVDESDLYNWEVAIFGPPNTHYEGGYFKARIKFPIDYPYSPPAFRFLTKMWHPNIYENGDVCISILHPPVDDPQSGELPSERWNPTQNVRYNRILQKPNSLINLDCNVNSSFPCDSLKQVLATKADAERDGVKVPTTLAEYCVRTRAPPADEGSTLFYDDYYDDEELDDDEEEDEDCCYDEDDSGTEDS
uniref:Ubiquitin-conjugating enzyme E2 R2-like n=1 Tax=Sinocyclocheilus rhinocerous TaxID=307959 RepID=A0A673MWE4_9TELE